MWMDLDPSAGGTVYWETSPDGSAWTVRNQAAAPIALDELTVVLGFGKSATGPMDASAS